MEDTFCSVEKAKEYIHQYNLDLRSAEQCVSYIEDKERCRENSWIKKEVIRAFHGEKFSEIWPEVIRLLGKGSKM